MKISIIVFLIIASPLVIADSFSLNSHKDNQELKVLTQSDIEILSTSKTWSLYMSSELSRIPGPTHLLNLKDTLSLSKKQIQEIQEINRLVSKKTKKIAKNYLDYEKEIERFFENGNKNEKYLRSLIANSGQYMALLRGEHLVGHLKVMSLLSKNQVSLYQKNNVNLEQHNH